MITFQDTLQQPQAPSAQLKPPTQPNLIDKGISAVKNIGQNVGNFIKQDFQRSPIGQQIGAVKKIVQSPQVKSIVKPVINKIASQPIIPPGAPGYDAARINKNSPIPTVGEFAKGRLVQPIKDALNPKLSNLDRVGSAAKAALAPFALPFTIAAGAGAGALKTARTGGDLNKNVRSGIANASDIGGTGLGVKNPLLAGGIDLVTGSPKGVVNSLKNVKGITQALYRSPHQGDIKMFDEFNTILHTDGLPVKQTLSAAKGIDTLLKTYIKERMPKVDYESLINGQIDKKVSVLQDFFKNADVPHPKIETGTYKMGLAGENQVKSAEGQPLGNLSLEHQKELSTLAPEEYAAARAKEINQGGAPASTKPLGEPPSSANNQPSDPVAKLTQALKEAKPLRAGQETAYTAERTQRIAQAQQAAQEAGGGQAGFEAKLSQLKGALSEPPKFEPLADKLQPQEIDHLHNLIDQNTVLTPFEKVSAGTAFNKLLTGRVPQEAELAKLNTVFGKEFTSSVTGNLTKMQKFMQTATDVANVPRALMSSVDFSAPLRQGVFAAARNPKEFGSAFVKQFQYFGSPGAYQDLFKEIQSRPNYPKMKESNLALTDMGGVNTREEAFMSNLAEKLPLGIGKMVRASDRAYSGFLNKFRADLFDKMAKGAGELKAEDPKFLKNMAEFINNATGRGSLTNIPIVGKNLQSAAPLLNSVFFSPRLIASRVNLLDPRYYLPRALGGRNIDPTVRKEAIKTLLTFTTTGMSILGAAKLAGADVGTDPRSADFGKIKVGNTRYDIWGGFQQYAKLMGQLITGETVNSTTGKVYSLGRGYKPTTRKDILQRFFESKYGPIPSFMNDVARGSDSMGQPLNFTTPNPFKNTIGQRFIPLMLQDVNDTINQYGEWGPVVSLPGLFGVGSQTYGNTAPTRGTRTRSSTRTRQGVGTRILP